MHSHCEDMGDNFEGVAVNPNDTTITAALDTSKKRQTSVVGDHFDKKLKQAQYRVSKEGDFRTLYFLVKDIGSKHTKFQQVNHFAKPLPTAAMYERALALAQLPNFKKDINILTSSRMGSLLRQMTYQEKGGSPLNTSPMAPPDKIRKTSSRSTINIHTPGVGSLASSRSHPSNFASGAANDINLIGSTSMGADSLAALHLEGRCQALSTGLSVVHTYTEGLMDSMDKTMSRLECLTPAQIIALGCREMIRAATVTSYGQSRVLALQEEHDKHGASSLQLELDTLRREHSQKIHDLETSVEKVTAENERLKGELASEKEAYTKLAKENKAIAKECESLAGKMKQDENLSIDVFFKCWLYNKEADFSYLGKNMECMLSYCRNREEAKTRQKAHATCIQVDSYLNFGVEASDDSLLDDLLDGSF
ncbi:hypothetical protein G4B88_031020 [Cannabis sativa]|uniref:Uncharacterized protein n=1 Tax=Cannabis sativa TaxID=3483 RepID=A0A7J6FW01_CANSA|nr:hypothetical protein G4B88_031020 [Cannabis sativa]